MGDKIFKFLEKSLYRIWDFSLAASIICTQNLSGNIIRS